MQCTAPPKTLIIVVNNATTGNGGVTLNSGNNLAGALFVQKGTLKFNGTATWTGTLWADTIEQWNGNATSQLTSCFLQNLPGRSDVGEVDTLPRGRPLSRSLP